jgi:hypothetical protein
LIFLVFYDRYFDTKYANTACGISLFLSVIIALQEFIQMSYSKKKSYIKKHQNKWDVLFMITSFAYYPTRILIINDFIGDSFLIYANVIIIILAIEKFFYLFRIFEDQGKIFILLQQCILDTVPFVIFLLVWVNFSAILTMAMEIEFEGVEYAGVPKYFRLVIIFLRSSVGDINAPFTMFGTGDELKWGSLSVSKIENTSKHNVILTLMWLQFVF